MRSVIAAGLFILMFSFCFITVRCTQNEDVKPVNTGEEFIEKVSLTKHLIPVFRRSCGVCHKRKGGRPKAVAQGFFYDEKEDIIGLVGKSIIPGKPEESELLAILNQSHTVGERKIVMPPPGTRYPKWHEKDLALFARWIEQGAQDN